MKPKISTKEAAIESTKRLCNRTAGKEKCEDIYNAYVYGHKDTDAYFKEMDGAIRSGKRSKNLAKARKAKTKKKKVKK